MGRDVAGRGAGWRALLGGMLLALAAAGSLGCANTTLRVTVEAGGKATLALGEENELRLTGPAELEFRCRTWGDSYFQVLDWTCSGGQLSDNGVRAIAAGVEAVVQAVLASTGVGAAGPALGGAAELIGGALQRRAAEIRAADAETPEERDAPPAGYVLPPDGPTITPNAGEVAPAP